jgi:hypothetical protein
MKVAIINMLFQSNIMSFYVEKPLLYIFILNTKVVSL